MPGSLADAPPRRSMEIIVVDNASSDGSSEMIQARFPHVRLIRSEENLGFAKGNNVAIRQCQGRYIALVNPDVIVFPAVWMLWRISLTRIPEWGMLARAF